MDARRLVIVGSAATIVYIWAFTFAMIAGWPVPWYMLPEGDWKIASGMPGAVGIDLYGRFLIGLVAGSIAGAIAWFATGRKKIGAPASPDIPNAAIWAFVVVAAAMLYFVVTLAMRDPQPIPLPEWYVPR
ncbi:hypothetical protein K8I61_02830 [bacterium]|nr:hypothetical protein [bacterium]